MKLENCKIYRITHIDNVPHILERGITNKNSTFKNPYYKNIGDSSLIKTRNSKEVTIDNGQSNIERSIKILLGEFIPFYFGVRMPMLYVAQLGGNFVEKATSASDIVYLACSVVRIVSNGNKFYFSDGHATDILSSFYDQTNINNLVYILDWKAIKSHYWGGNENLDLKRKKQAEFLVLDDIAPDCLHGIGCYDSLANEKLIAMGVDEKTIKIIPESYY